MNNKGILIVVSGFSGAGKGTLMKELLTRYPDTYALSISATTRAPREGEVDGREYFFVSKDEFEKMIAKDKLIEYAKYVENYYGTPRDYVENKLEEGRDVILEIEIQGALNIKKLFPDTLLLFVTPPSAEELKKAARGQRHRDDGCHRVPYGPGLRGGGQGMENYDYLIVNDSLDSCVEEMHAIIRGEHRRSSRNREFMQEIKQDLERMKH